MGVYAQRAVLADPLVFSSCLFVVYWCVYSTPPKNLLLPICPPVCLSGIANCGFLPFLSNTSSLTNGTAGCRPFIAEKKDVTRPRYPSLPTFKRCTILCEAFEIIAEKYDEKQAELVCFFPPPLTSHASSALCGKALSLGAGSTEDRRVTAKCRRSEAAILHLSGGGVALVNISS